MGPSPGNEANKHDMIEGCCSAQKLVLIFEGYVTSPTKLATLRWLRVLQGIQVQFLTLYITTPQIFPPWRQSFKRDGLDIKTS